MPHLGVAVALSLLTIGARRACLTASSTAAVHRSPTCSRHRLGPDRGFDQAMRGLIRFLSHRHARCCSTGGSKSI